jgi:aspartyl-tRNA(Asn)/glutamyl-tRNA(Gln) amidotransferase subunit A
MPDQDVTGLTIADATALIYKRELTAYELVDACAKRITALNPLVNAFITPAIDEALEAAREADARAKRRATLGPLHGIPVALKDSLDVNGLPTTAGSGVLRGNIATRDSEVAARLRQAGAVILGKLNMHEWGFGITTRNDHYGWCRNPWDLHRIPGGSSGGSGAAVAAGMCLGSIGEDTGGSVRFPAALNGIVGLRPSFGRISTRGGIPISWSYDTVGPLARTVHDVAIMTQVLAGYDPDDPVSVDRAVDDYRAALRGGVDGIRLGVPGNYFFEGVDPEVARATGAAIRDLESLGATAVDLTIPSPEDASEACRVLIWSEAAAYHRGRMEEHPDTYSPDTLEFIKSGSEFRGMDYARARHFARTWHRAVLRLMDAARVDVVVTPVTSIAAPLIAESEAVETTFKLVRQVYPFSLIRWPGLALPCGFVNGLPVGLHVVAPDFSEPLLFRVGYAYQQKTDWHIRRPPIATASRPGAPDAAH